MKVYNQAKTQILEDYDLDKGKLVKDVLTTHHEAVQGVEEQGHYETIAEYPNGGKDVKWVIDVPKVEAKEAYDETEEIRVYVPYTQAELRKINAEKRILELKMLLANSDYQAIKYAEGEMSASEYAPMKANRQAWRAEINRLESEL